MTNISKIKSFNLHPDYTDEEREFMIALDRYKRENHRPHPTCVEVLQVLKNLGYSKCKKE